MECEATRALAAVRGVCQPPPRSVVHQRTSSTVAAEGVHRSAEGPTSCSANVDVHRLEWGYGIKVSICRLMRIACATGREKGRQLKVFSIREKMDAPSPGLFLAKNSCDFT